MSVALMNHVMSRRLAALQGVLSVVVFAVLFAAAPQHAVALDSDKITDARVQVSNDQMRQLEVTPV